MEKCRLGSIHCKNSRDKMKVAGQFKGKIFLCSSCKEPVKVRPSRLGRKNHFCGKPCYHKFRWGDKRTKTVKCKVCSTEILRQINQLNARKGGPFCSIACSGKWRTAAFSGSNSPNWKGGETIHYGGREWKVQRAKARKRDKYRCQDCGVTKKDQRKNLDVHHIVSYKKYKDITRAHRLENLITLCRKCHMNRHKHCESNVKHSNAGA